MSKVTLEDISTALNISKNTVSKALRGAPGVSDELRKKIIALASDMGYKKSYTPSDTPMKNITVICRKTFFSDVTFWSHVFYGISHCTSKKNINLNIITIDETREDSLETFVSINTRPTDGFIVVGTLSNELLLKIKSINVPMVVLDHFNEDIECDYINSGNKIGIFKAIKYLSENNHKNIGFISNSMSVYSFIERYESYIRYMNQLNLPINNNFIWLDAVYLETDYYKNKINQMKKDKDFPTAWVCVNDTIAITFIKALNELGLSVPNDVSVMGFDNIAEFLYLDLSTIDVPKQTMGQKAVEQLIYRLENPDAPYENIILNTKLVTRNSVKKI